MANVSSMRKKLSPLGIEVLSSVLSQRDEKKAQRNQIFFKTSLGQYGEGDQWLGLTTPQLRILAKAHHLDLDLDDIYHYLLSPWHEIRALSTFMLVYQYEWSAKEKKQKHQKKIVDFYLHFGHLFNNWDLIDSSAHKILGHWLLEKKDRSILKKLASSANLWCRRMSVVSTWQLIKHDDFEWTLYLVNKLKNDREDLIHKACGWMLREVGKRDEKVLTDFLSSHARTLPRTTLRYSIEKLSPAVRKKYLLLKNHSC